MEKKVYEWCDSVLKRYEYEMLGYSKKKVDKSCYIAL